MAVSTLVPLASLQGREKTIQCQYKELRMVGYGAFGDVYVAKDTQTGEQIAIKKIRKGCGIDARSELVFHVRAAIHCEYITNLKCFYETNTHFCLVMDFYPMDLSDYINFNGKINEQEASVLFKQLVEAVQTFEQLGIYHGDLKSNNIMMSMDLKSLRVTDFGLATFTTDEWCSDFAGTLAPPEVISKLNHLYKQKDATMWSLGWILFEMICGYSPYEDDRNVTSGFYFILPSVSDVCKSLIKKLLSYYPQDRPQSFEDVLKHPFLC